MTEKLLSGESLEIERYELFEQPRYRFELDRREFFRVFGAGVVVCLMADGALGQESGGEGRPSRGAQTQELAAWLHVDEDGRITVCTGKVEIGQNIRTSLSQVVAEELRAPLDAIRLVMADTDLVPFDMGTFGSMTTPVMASQLRKVAATARQWFVELAAERMMVEPEALVAADAAVVHPPTRRSFTYGQLAKDQKLTKTVSSSAPTTRPDAWQIIGTSAPKVDGRAIVTGRHQYASDIRRPGMLFGKVLRPERFNATLASVDLSAAEALAGVSAVRDGDFVGVAAVNQRLAEQALSAIKAQWKAEPQTSSATLFEDLKKQAAGAAGKGRSNFNRGSVESGLEQAKHKVETTYTISYIAHAPLEPRAAVAEWNDGKLTVWTGTQRPFGVRADLARAFGMPQERVRVIVPDMGSGYGGKHTAESAIEAARLAKGSGKPVKLVWTREEEFSWSYFRPAGVIEVSAGVAEDGKITAWEFHNYNSGPSAIRPLYDIGSQRVQFHAAESPLRQGSYRGLAATANHFARESHVDALAHAVGIDPLEFRLKNLSESNKEQQRLRAVLQAAAKAFGWGASKAAADHGFGIAGGSEKGSYVASCA